ncbi:MAG: hypothetical protein PHR43_07175 [Dehalococcoidales bacterium]|nr:hypothetical protein [Dehalococcoidales bacterium]
MPFIVGAIVVVLIAVAVWLILRRRAAPGEAGKYWEVIGEAPEFTRVPGWVKKYSTQSSLMGDLANNAEYLLLHGRMCDYRVIAAGQNGEQVVVQRRKR